MAVLLQCTKLCNMIFQIVFFSVMLLAYVWLDFLENEREFETPGMWTTKHGEKVEVNWWTALLTFIFVVLAFFVIRHAYHIDTQTHPITYRITSCWIWALLFSVLVLVAWRLAAINHQAPNPGMGTWKIITDDIRRWIQQDQDGHVDNGGVSTCSVSCALRGKLDEDRSEAWDRKCSERVQWAIEHEYKHIDHNEKMNICIDAYLEVTLECPQCGECSARSVGCDEGDLWLFPKIWAVILAGAILYTGVLACSSFSAAKEEKHEGFTPLKTEEKNKGFTPLRTTSGF